MSISKRLKKLGISLLAVTAIIALCSNCAQKFFYYPDKLDYGSPKNQQLSFEEITFPSKDGTKLNGWFVPAKGVANPKDAKGTVIHFHGNAQNISAHWGFVSWLPEQGFNVFTFDYRGYGKSAGKVDAKGIFEDSLAAIDYVRNRPDVDPEKLVIFAQSLGGNNAIAAVGSGNRQGIQAVAVESTFYSYASIANDQLSSAGALVNNRYSAAKYIENISPIPLLLIHGNQDAVINHKHSERLFEPAKEPKQLWIVPTGEHIEAMNPRFDGKYQKDLIQFFEQALSQSELK